MNISFPINNFSHAFNILSDLFEMDIQTHGQTNSFSFEWDGNIIHCFNSDIMATTMAPEIVIELFHLHHPWSEIVKRLELYCYKNQTSYANFDMTLNVGKQSLIWKISSLLYLEIYFSPCKEDQYSKIQSIEQ